MCLYQEPPDAPLELRPGYRPEVAALDPTEPHTLRNLEGFLEDNLGSEALQEIRTGGRRFVVLVGEGREALEGAEAGGWTVEDPLRKNQGFHQVSRAVTPEGEPVMLLWRVNGHDRVGYVQGLLKMAGLEESRVATAGKVRSFQSEYAGAFRRLGPAPDLVVYGMARTAAASVLMAHPVRNSLDLARLYREKGPPKHAWDRTMGDLEGLSAQVMELRGGQRVWFLSPLYGDLSRDLLDALRAYGVDNFHFAGTAGGVNPALEVGQVLEPEREILPDGSTRPLDFLAPSPKAAPGGDYLRVDSPNGETVRWAEESSAAGADLVEVELGYWLEAARRDPSMNLGVSLVVSDVLQGENHRDMTEWSWKDAAGAREALREAVAAHLGLSDPEDLRVERFETKPLLG